MSRLSWAECSAPITHFCAAIARATFKCSAWTGTRRRVAKILFVTGTDTGVGKTLVVASLLYHLRQRDVSALAMKPFCSGSRADVQLLQRIQDGAVTNEEANPFYFREPVAPLVAARKTGRE